jgi:hypothetical protein
VGGNGGGGPNAGPPGFSVAVGEVEDGVCTRHLSGVHPEVVFLGGVEGEFVVLTGVFAHPHLKAVADVEPAVEKAVDRVVVLVDE